MYCWYIKNVFDVQHLLFDYFEISEDHMKYHHRLCNFFLYAIAGFRVTTLRSTIDGKIVYSVDYYYCYYCQNAEYVGRQQIA